MIHKKNCRGCVRHDIKEKGHGKKFVENPTQKCIRTKLTQLVMLAIATCTI